MGNGVLEQHSVLDQAVDIWRSYQLVAITFEMVSPNCISPMRITFLEGKLKFDSGDGGRPQNDKNTASRKQGITILLSEVLDLRFGTAIIALLDLSILHSDVDQRMLHIERVNKFLPLFAKACQFKLCFALGAQSDFDRSLSILTLQTSPHTKIACPSAAVIFSAVSWSRQTHESTTTTFGPSEDQWPWPFHF